MSFAITQGLFLLDIVDYYAIIGLPMNAEAKSVRKAYLQIAQRLHPDTCKVSDDAEKKIASELLSRLVNPAYEKLSKAESWSEYQVILKQISRQLSNRDASTLKLQFASAKELYESVHDFPKMYEEKVQCLAKDNYRDMSTVLAAIAELSELNLVYLNSLGKDGLSVKSTESSQRKIFTPSNNTTSTVVAPQPSVTKTYSLAQAAKSTTSSALEAAIWRGEDHLKKGNYSKAILEFRDAIQLDPNSYKAHALMGMAYLQQKQLAMAKVHIKKAYMAKPSDAFVRQAKEALEKEMGTALDTHAGLKKPARGSVPEKKGGLFGGLFWGKKK